MNSSSSNLFQFSTSSSPRIIDTTSGERNEPSSNAHERGRSPQDSRIQKVTEKRLREEEIKPNKKLLVDLTSPQFNPQSIEDCLRSIHQIYDNHAHPSYQDCVIAATEQSKLKRMISLKLKENAFTALMPEEKFRIIEEILKGIGHFPATDTFKEEDEKLLLELKTLCETLGLEQGRAIIDGIERLHLPTLAYNRAACFSQEAAEKISLLKEEEDGVDWQQIFQLVNESIARFIQLEAMYEKLGQRASQQACTRVLSLGYEELADHHFDYAKQLEPLGKQEALLKAIELYQEALKRGSEHPIDISLSIVHTKYELVFCLKDLGKLPESVAEMRALLNFLDEAIPPAKFYKSKPEVIQYQCEALFFLYKTEGNELLREHAVQALKTYVPHFARKKKPQATDLDALNFLKQFVNDFHIDELNHYFVLQGFRMAPATSPDFFASRLAQISEGVRTAAKEEFAITFSISLKKHQKEALQACQLHLSSGKKGGYYTIPTGGGKTILMLMKVLAVKMPTLIIVPTTLLMDQTIENIKKLSPKTSVNRFDGLAKDRFKGEILVTTYQSLQFDQRRESPRINLDQFGLVFADEAHRGLTKERAEVLFQLQRHAFVFGLTATDTFDTDRVKGSFGKVEEVFGPSIFEVGLVELIENKQLSPVKNVFVRVPNIFSKHKRYKKASQDYTDKEIAELINQEKFNTIVQDIYFHEYDPYTKESLYGQPALIFCAGIDHAEAVCEILNRAVKEKRTHPLAACVHSKIPAKIRNERIEAHKRGDIPVLVGDSVFAEGYDNPAERIGFFLRPTLSTVFAKQRGGRLLRLFEGKKNALIFDFVYKGIDQKKFREFLNGKPWVGLDCSAKPVVKPRDTEGYQVDWRPEMDVEENSSSLQARTDINDRISAMSQSRLPLSSAYQSAAHSIISALEPLPRLPPPPHLEDIQCFSSSTDLPRNPPVGASLSFSTSSDLFPQTTPQTANFGNNPIDDLLFQLPLEPSDSLQFPPFGESDFDVASFFADLDDVIPAGKKSKAAHSKEDLF